MISFLRLGNHGRLGNQMFQYAIVKAVSTKRGYEARIPRYEGLEIVEVFDIPEPALGEGDAERLVNTYTEPHFSFSDAVFDVPDDCNLHGYFQSERYFQHCADELRASLSFNPTVMERVRTESSRLLSGIWHRPTTVSLHVRRGDYLSLPNHHPVCDPQYYAGALDLLEERFGRLRVVVFSDDIDWCRKTFRGRRYRFAIGNDLGTDMCLMSRCDHHVIANSSFSWWAAWLNPSADKVVIAPATWFGPECPQDTQDLLPEGWLTL